MSQPMAYGPPPPVVHGATWVMCELLSWACAVVVLLWVAALAYHRSARFMSIRLRASLHQDLWPFILPVIVIQHIVGVFEYGDPFNVVRIVGTAFVVVMWWLCRDDDDDRWRRRRRKARQKITELAGKLVVVPSADTA